MRHFLPDVVEAVGKGDEKDGRFDGYIDDYFPLKCKFFDKLPFRERTWVAFQRLEK
jgi:hypothetical protein